MKPILNNITQDLQLASYNPKTVEAYSYHVKKYLDHFAKEPAFITEDGIKQYFLYLKYKKKLSGSASPPASGTAPKPYPELNLCTGKPWIWILRCLE